MKITIEIIPHDQQRYETCGDWQWSPDWKELNIYVSAMDDLESETGIAVHEMREAILCRYRGISDETVTNWDVTHPESNDPGSLKGCPYGVEHHAAEFAERAFIAAGHLAWEEHEGNVSRSFT